MTLLKIINPENASDEEVAKFRIREAARAIVYDREGKIGILHVSNEGYHKLPGGGIEAGEDIITALKRECQEELGCDIEVLREVGEIIEYRKIFQIKQTSYVYLANLVGEKRNPSLTDKEVAYGLETQWLSLDEAMNILASDKPTLDIAKLYMVPRDRTILEIAKIYEIH